MALNSNSQGFIEQLIKLDMVSSKNNDFVMVLYIPRGFSDENEIFQANMQQYMSNNTYKDFLNSLGHPIDCKSSLW